MFQRRGIRGLLILILTVGLVALPNAATAFEDCSHCEECTLSLLYEVCQELTGCEGDWCNYQGPSACDCQPIE